MTSVVQKINWSDMIDVTYEIKRDTYISLIKVSIVMVTNRGHQS